MQFLAAEVRFILPADDSRIDWTIDWAVLRFAEETEIADWIIWSGVGFCGTLELDKEDAQVSGNLVALQA